MYLLIRIPQNVFQKYRHRFGNDNSLSQSPLYIGVSSLLGYTAGYYLCIGGRVRAAKTKKRLLT